MESAINFAQNLPGSEIYTFVEDWEAARVAGKWFALFTEHDGKAIVNLKADPTDVRLLRETYEGITPAYHMNKKHWISVYLNSDVSDELLLQLIVESYLTVVSKLPKRLRPINPENFAHDAAHSSAHGAAHNIAHNN